MTPPPSTCVYYSDCNKGYPCAIVETGGDEFSDPTEGLCASWDPAGAVDLVGSVRYVDDLFVRNILDDPTQLVTCDDAGLLTPDGGFEVVDANSGEALYELGLRNGDILLEINSMPLEDYDDVAAAWTDLTVVNPVSSLDLYILRGATYMHLYYELV